MATNSLEIECPECGEMIDVEEQYSHQLQEQSANERKQMKIKIRKELQASHSSEIDEIKADLAEKDKLLRGKKDADEVKDIKIQEMEHLLKTQDKQVEIKIQTAALEARKEEAEKYEQLAEAAAQQQNAGLKQEKTELEIKNKALGDQMRQQAELHKEALRKAEQGSVQTQGEGGEIFIEDVLRQAFPQDVISEVPKGTKGADVLHTVRFGSDLEAGMIVWEGKRTKQWSNAWISKVKEDTVRAQGDISIIVSDVLPRNISQMKRHEENVWFCTYNELLGLAMALRDGLIRAETAVKSQEGKGTKMEILYDYMSSKGFSNEMRLINDSYVAELDIIAKEENSMQKHWKARKKAAKARLMGFSEFMGTIKTIATELPAIKEIEAADQKALPSPEEDDSN